MAGTVRRALLVTLPAVAAALGSAAAWSIPAPPGAGAATPLEIRPIPQRPPGPTPGFAPAQPARPPDDAYCHQVYDSTCYSPVELRHAYHVNSLLQAGDNGAGQTIVIVDSFGSPTIQSDLARFDQDYGLPAPPSFQVVAPLGTVPYDPTTSHMVGWAEETSLDVEWAHAMAPGAGIVLLTTPVDESQGVTGMPQFLSVERYALDHHLGQVLSQSWGTAENNLFSTKGRRIMSRFDALYRQAGQAGVTVFASAGDSGSTNVDTHGNYFPYPTVGFPASSPWVTAVGGTRLWASLTGHYRREGVWNASGSATGGGISQVEPERPYQRSLPAWRQQQLGGHRGLPDLAMDADPDSGVPVYTSFAGAATGYRIFGGTSLGCPVWSGIVADLDQRAGQPLGFLNPALYRLGSSSSQPGAFHDVTAGNNTAHGVAGYHATPGWDLTTGWGTPDLARLPAALQPTP